MTLPLPDFDLAPLEGLDPKSLVRGDQDRVGELMLGLALAFDDLKDIAYLVHQKSTLIEQARADTLARYGQFSGMQKHLARWLCGMAHEILELLSKSKSAVESPEFQALIKPLLKEYRDDWQILWDAARGVDAPQKTDRLGYVLKRARNNLAFHYAPRALRDGYRAHFSSGKPHSEQAVISLGDNMEATRFYYADAAAEAYLEDVLGMSGEQWTELARRLNRVLYALLRQFIDARAPGRSPYPPSVPR
jgi:hypothetical protein